MKVPIRIDLQFKIYEYKEIYDLHLIKKIPQKGKIESISDLFCNYFPKDFYVQIFVSDYFIGFLNTRIGI